MRNLLSANRLTFLFFCFCFSGCHPAAKRRDLLFHQESLRKKSGPHSGRELRAISDSQLNKQIAYQPRV
jgi:hypothetical protein